MMEMEHGFWEKSKYCTTTDAEKDSQSRLRELQGVMLNKDWIKLKRNYALKREIMEEQEWRALHVVVLNNAKKKKLQHKAGVRRGKNSECQNDK